MQYTIKPRTALEEKILSHPEMQESLAYTYVNGSRKDKSVGQHVEHLLAFIDFLDMPKQSEELRLLALLHDFGKFRTQYSANGHLIGPSHAMISTEFSKQFIDDPTLLEIILKHDKYVQFHRKEQKTGSVSEQKFRSVFSGVDIGLLIRFNYVDSCEREKDSIKWFEDRCVLLGLQSEKVYEIAPKVLVDYSEIFP